MTAPKSLRKAVCLGVFFLNFGCKTPPVPPEADRVKSLEADLGRAGGSFFAPDESEAFRRKLVALDARLAVERAKFGWFRDYRRLRESFRRLVEDGEAILGRIADAKSSRSRAFHSAAGELESQVGRLKGITGFFNESDVIRQSATQAEIKLAEARLLVEKEKFAEAQKAAAEGMAFVEKAQASAADLLSRYLDPEQLARWRAQADETVAASQKSGGVALIVNKVERTLTVYRRGEKVGVYGVGLGKYGLSDKLYSGDEATPEGRYRIVRKFPNSTFYKALLIDYPNDEDRREFAAARKKGILPEGVTIGGAIEIHGGGKDNLTLGCVGLENAEMDAVYRWAEVGTPVTIVGALAVEETILGEVGKFIKHE